MSQLIDPLEWLHEALTPFSIDNWNVVTTPADTNPQLWQCEISFTIPSRRPNGTENNIRRRGALGFSQRSAQEGAVNLCIHALRHVGFNIPDFSYYKEMALRYQGYTAISLSEWTAGSNTFDVVQSTYIY